MKIKEIWRILLSLFKPFKPFPPEEKKKTIKEGFLFRVSCEVSRIELRVTQNNMWVFWGMAWRNTVLVPLTLSSGDNGTVSPHPSPGPIGIGQQNDCGRTYRFYICFAAAAHFLDLLLILELVLKCTKHFHNFSQSI